MFSGEGKHYPHRKTLNFKPETVALPGLGIIIIVLNCKGSVLQDNYF
jgi:hypothetical protein